MHRCIATSRTWILVFIFVIVRARVYNYIRFQESSFFLKIGVKYIFIHDRNLAQATSVLQ